MMKKINYGFVAVLLFLAVMACKKTPEVSCNSPTNDAAMSRELIVGSWRLHRMVFTSDSFYVRYPPKSGEISIKFKSNGTLEYYKNGDFIDSCRYEIDKFSKYSFYPPDSVINVLRLINRNPLSMLIGLQDIVPIRICNDSLYLRYDSFRYHSVGDNYYYRY